MIFRRAQKIDATMISQLILPLVIKYILPSCTQQGGQLLLQSMSSQNIEKYFALGYVYQVVEVQSEIIAVIGIRENSHLYHLFVADPYQGRGIAKSLWESAKDECIAKGNNSEFTVNAALNAVALYQNWGFVQLSAVRERSGIKHLPMRLTI